MFEPKAKRGMCIRRGVGIAAMGVIAVGVLGWVVMSLWNGLMPPLFGLRSIHFWQAVGLLVLSRILFGGFHHGHGRGPRRRHAMMQRWGSMTPEEREKFRRGFRGRFCCQPEPRA